MISFGCFREWFLVDKLHHSNATGNKITVKCNNKTQESISINSSPFWCVLSFDRLLFFDVPVPLLLLFFLVFACGGVSLWLFFCFFCFFGFFCFLLLLSLTVAVVAVVAAAGGGCHGGDGGGGDADGGAGASVGAGTGSAGGTGSAAEANAATLHEGCCGKSGLV